MPGRAMDVAVAGERCAARTPFLAIATFLLLSNQRYRHKQRSENPVAHGNFCNR
jgi:hypothetical protein